LTEIHIIPEVPGRSWRRYPAKSSRRREFRDDAFGNGMRVFGVLINHRFKLISKTVWSFWDISDEFFDLTKTVLHVRMMNASDILK
jgi:hypothetical protein